MSLTYKNPLTSTQLDGSNSVSRTSVFGTNFSVLQTGGYMEVYTLQDLYYIIPEGSTGLVEYSGNTIPLQFTISQNTQTYPNTLTLNSDNISSGRQRLGMLVYVYENNLTYQLRIRNYDDLWQGALDTQDIIETSFGTTVLQLGLGGYALIEAWTGTTIEGVNGYTKDNAKWIIYQGDGGGSTVTGGTSYAGTGATTAITLTLSANNQSTGVTINMAPALTYYNNDPVKRTVGGIIDNSNPFTGGKTFQQIIEEIFYPADKPTIVYSSVSPFTATGDFAANTLYEIGKEGSIVLNATFVRGSSSANPQPIKRMGLPNTYNFTGPEYFTPQVFLNSGLTQSTISVEIICEQGNNTFNVSVDYDQGEIPVYDTGSPYYDSLFTNAGTKTKSLSFEGVYPIFANSEDVTDNEGVRQGLISMINSTSIIIDYLEPEQKPDVGTVYRHYFDLPTVWPKTYSNTQVFSRLANGYVDIQMFPLYSQVTHIIQGNEITYDRYRCNFPTAMGGRLIKISFS